MKKVKLLLSALLVIAYSSASAQVEKTTSTTTTTTTTALPDWGVAGADNARYYYIPDVDSYYDIRNGNFVYMNNGQWTKSAEVPEMYRDVDLYDAYKVVLTEDREPFTDYDKLKVKYAKGYKGDPQKTVKIKKRKDGTLKIKEK